ncbi:MFS transporter [Magnetospira sp. QH-2]|uniref:MFS transporter n=1 Tax=Magnetospira sp. (strain QH-2) TaxID=1288970 RepID=UPI0003E81030|nr:MFS transporter [Magnetospira sp. QH-2]CCQ72914.1 putative membrane transport protein [Magnetospira sp. QH-2]
MTVFKVFFPFACGYFLSYLYRTVNNVIAPDLIRELDLTASDLGLLTSTYFLTFALFQLPLGVLLDRFGARRTEALLLLFAAAGAALFALSESLTGLLIGRSLIGFGVSACLMAAFTAFVAWFPPEKLPQINGFQMAAGSLGALAATQPVEWALQITDWRGLFWGVALATVVVAGLIWTVVPEKPQKAKAHDPGEALRGVAEVFTSPLFWRVAPFSFLVQASFIAIQSLWSGPWLRDVAGFERQEVGPALLLIALAMMVGYMGSGTLATKLARRGLAPMTVAVTGMTIGIGIQIGLALQWTEAALPLWIAFGLVGAANILPYAALSQAFPDRLAGRVNTGLNLLVFVAAFIGQWGIGAVIDLWPQPGPDSYAPEGYQAAFLVLVGLQVLGLIWFLIRRDVPIRPLSQGE